uniref:Uncharacterized protein n=1 Tax=Vespula pensylvanica TaxID=30213 RepID=A0A834P7Q5_VESPE|nr:hypothetical protein H0235_004677 [Vespula pensylvanica]
MKLNEARTINHFSETVACLYACVFEECCCVYGSRCYFVPVCFDGSSSDGGGGGGGSSSNSSSSSSSGDGGGGGCIVVVVVVLVGGWYQGRTVSMRSEEGRVDGGY